MRDKRETEWRWTERERERERDEADTKIETIEREQKIEMKRER